MFKVRAQQTMWLVRLHRLIKAGNLIGPIALTLKRLWEIFPFVGDKSSIPEILFVINIFYIWFGLRSLLAGRGRPIVRPLEGPPVRRAQRERRARSGPKVRQRRRGSHLFQLVFLCRRVGGCQGLVLRRALILLHICVVLLKCRLWIIKYTTIALSWC